MNTFYIESTSRGSPEPNSDAYVLQASVLGGPVLWACVACSFVDELLLFLDIFPSQ